MIVRSLIFLLAFMALILALPPLRQHLFAKLRQRDWRELKQNLIAALVIYFIISLLFTLYKYGGSE